VSHAGGEDDGIILVVAVMGDGGGMGGESLLAKAPFLGFAEGEDGEACGTHVAEIGGDAVGIVGEANLGEEPERAERAVERHDVTQDLLIELPFGIEHAEASADGGPLGTFAEGLTGFAHVPHGVAVDVTEGGRAARDGVVHSPNETSLFRDGDVGLGDLLKRKRIRHEIRIAQPCTSVKRNTLSVVSKKDARTGSLVQP
jgi:hypothetical protein